MFFSMCVARQHQGCLARQQPGLPLVRYGSCFAGSRGGPGWELL
jgi:hypothetical protein